MLHVRPMSFFFFFFFFLLLLLLLVVVVGPLYLWTSLSVSFSGIKLPPLSDRFLSSLQGPAQICDIELEAGVPETGCLSCANLKLSPVSVKQKKFLVRLPWRCDMKRVELRLLV